MPVNVDRWKEYERDRRLHEHLVHVLTHLDFTPLPPPRSMWRELGFVTAIALPISALVLTLVALLAIWLS